MPPPDAAVPLRVAGGGTAWIHPEDTLRVAPFAWYYRGDGYVATTMQTENGRKNVYLHRFILGAGPDDPIVHHVDGNRLNCCRDNLEFSTHAKNRRAARASRDPRKTSRYRGVAWSKQRRKWQAYVKVGATLFTAGFFDDELEAARARDRLAREKHGSYAALNLPPG